MRLKKKNIKNKLILINTIVSCEEKIKDFVFPNLNKILKSKKIKNFYFVPDILITKKIFSLYKNIRLIAKKNYFLKESIISFTEFFNCFILTLFKKPKQVSRNSIFENIDFSEIILEEMKKKSDFFSEFQSNLKIIFIKKLHKFGFKLKKSIGRFENQSLDKAWFYGINIYYPKIENIGFQNFLYYPHLLNQSPTFHENKLKLIPKNCRYK